MEVAPKFGFPIKILKELTNVIFSRILLREDSFMHQFIGRKYELKRLSTVLDSSAASFIVINGRRRIGKSRLIQEFAKPFPFFRFAGLVPRKGLKAQDQRNEFARQFREQFKIPMVKKNDWGEIFSQLALQIKKNRVVILFDEISWMAYDDSDFLGKLKNAWDFHFSNNSKLILFLCGSVSSWIDENLLSSTAFMGRPTLHLLLKELELPDCNHFWGDSSNNFISSYEKLKILSLTGGVPRYLELMNPKLTAEENAKNLFFNKESVLFDEFKKIFVDVYGKRNSVYKSIIELLISEKLTQEQIAQSLDFPIGGDLSTKLNDLILGGFIARDYTWKLESGKISNLSRYRLCDNYLRFSLKYILPNRALIEKGRFLNRSLKSLPGWDTIIGLQFENLVLNNHKKILECLNLLDEDIIFDNPYFQRKTNRIQGCQIDYLIQTRHDSLYICEIKFDKEPIGMNIIKEVKEKMLKIKSPKFMSKRAVLIHVNGVKESVMDISFFYKIIDFSQLLM